MKPRLPFTLVLASALAAFPAAAQQDFSKVEIKTTHVAGNIHLLEGRGGNIAVSAGPDGVLMVDNQFLPLAAKIEAAVVKLGAGPLKFMLNTHWHGDHAGGNSHFGKMGIIIAHQNVRTRLVGSGAKSAPPEALPVIVVDRSASVHFNGEEIRLRYFGPGHTDGDVIVFFARSDVIHMGDQFINGGFPFIDVASGGEVEGFIQTVAEVLKRCGEKTRIIPGHGKLATRVDLQAYHDMLVESSAVVKKGIAAGRTLEQIKAEGLPARWKAFGGGFISTHRWIETLFAGFSRK